MSDMNAVSQGAQRISVRGAAFGLFAGLKAFYARQVAYQQSYNELSGLTDRELNDLGIARSQIHGIAREAARSL